MKSDARVALYAPSTIQAILSLPTSVGGSTGYFPPGSTTVVVGYTPISVKPVTTYAKTVPTTPVLIAPEAGSESFVSTAADISGTAVTDASTSASSSGVPTSIPSPISTPSSGLSTGSKAGIGVGVAGGVCLLAALGIAFLNFQRRRRARLAQQASGPQYPQYPPNPQHQSYQGAPYYSPQEKANWPGNYVPPNGQMPTTYGDAQYKAQAPVELASEHRVHELGSEPAPGNTPAPPYADPKDAQHSNSPS
ncbi:MAG: hypothetical protein M1820_001090 [Bogoriella megaspora]|nr:MAG: hypothetical protein M1820_001090 [Bogoriella megaspora]